MIDLKIEKIKNDTFFCETCLYAEDVAGSPLMHCRVMHGDTFTNYWCPQGAWLVDGQFLGFDQAIRLLKRKLSGDDWDKVTAPRIDYIMKTEPKPPKIRKDKKNKETKG